MARHWFSFAVVASLLVMVTSIVYAQGKAPASTQLGSPVKGQFKKFGQNGVVEMASGTRDVYVQLAPKCRTVISGIAEPSFLAPQMFVKIPEIEANALGETKGAIKKLDIVAPDPNTEIPTFYTESATASLTQKKLTKEEAEKFNKYFVRGTITKISGDDNERELQIKVPNVTVTAKLAPDCKIEVLSDAVRFARPGDEAEVREGSEVQVPMPPAPKAAKNAPKGATPAAAPQGPRFIIATWFQVTAKEPLTGKKKPAGKK
ncbi:MAG: hypothetical protein JNM18_02725 [Planctomycetaceae bacterium]|nr:hypothetical protein [Planctomycetaceae bacterium]